MKTRSILGLIITLAFPFICCVITIYDFGNIQPARESYIIGFDLLFACFMITIIPALLGFLGGSIANNKID